MRREPCVAWRRTVVLVTAFVGSWFVVLDGQVSIPPRADRSIHDYAGVLAPAEIATMEQQHRALFAQTEVSVVIVTTDTLEGENASDFGLRLAESWQPGTRATERGIVVVLAVSDRDVAIQTGYGAEGFLPDARVGAILDAAIPAFAQNDWSAGTMLVSQSLVGTAAAEFGVSVDGMVPVPPPVRGRLAGAASPGEAAAANAGLTGALGRLLAISENYPQLRSNENFIRLQDELAGSENRIAVERRRYNDAVRVYNTNVRQFPNNLMAGTFGFDSREYFEGDEAAQEVPTVQF